MFTALDNFENYLDSSAPVDDAIRSVRTTYTASEAHLERYRVHFNSRVSSERMRCGRVWTLYDSYMTFLCTYVVDTVVR